MEVVRVGCQVFKGDDHCVIDFCTDGGTQETWRGKMMRSSSRAGITTHGPRYPIAG